ncbi:MAG: ABC transporter permease [Desulfobulbaceae bacterium]|nr:ABC transporter permease [Desulfobulbaceae bacterium]HIJ79834.1 ABC transporter permease [Deltaproteobacteria bacterium]
MHLYPNILIGLTGHYALRMGSYICNLTAFTFRAFRDWRLRHSLFNRKTYSPLISQIIFTGVDAMPVITILGLITGFIITFRLISLFDNLGGTKNMTAILIDLVGLELGPLIAAIILVSRSGSAIAVDIGNMKLHGEIESLKLLGININDLLTTPRMIGSSLSQLVLAVYFTIIALAGGIMISAILLSVNYFKYMGELIHRLTPLIIITFIFKNLLFGLLIGTAACYHGLQVQSSRTEIPQQTQRAIMNSLILIFLLDALIMVVAI